MTVEINYKTVRTDFTRYHSGASKFLNEYQMSSLRQALYCAVNNTLMFDIGDNYGGSPKRNIDDWKTKNPAWVDVIEQVKPFLIENIRKNKETAISSQKRRGFEKAAVGNTGMHTDAMMTMAYLRETDKVGKGGSNLHVSEDKQTLSLWGSDALHRIGKNEYLMGRGMSLSMNVDFSTRSRILGIVAMTPGLTLWPTLSHSLVNRENQEKNVDQAEIVYDFICSQLRLAQLKWPTAQLHKESFAQIHYNSLALFADWAARWPEAMTDSHRAEVREYLDLFGNIKQMKEYNTALKMQFALTGKIQ
jgi:hypothetical protein